MTVVVTVMAMVAAVVVTFAAAFDGTRESPQEARPRPYSGKRIWAYERGVFHS
jgi:hypothetical protein